ncbi:MAG TPA: M23 family metallopeptidase, partial [Ilumatobacteraceae bacterium]
HKDLEKKQAQADKATKDLQDAQKDANTKKQQALDEVAQLKVIEQDRLKDEAVQRALEAQKQKEAEAAQKAAAAKLLADQAAAAAAAPVSSDDANPDGGGADGGDDGQGAITGNAISASSSGGTTGGGGTGARPFGVGTQIYGVGQDWVCPLQGAPYAFSDTFGAPRSGGRLHQGVDMIAAKGTQIVAVVDGIATAEQNTLGGNAITFAGSDGNRYYYAHLDGYATLGSVVKGTVIGYVGQTGDAIYSTAHLHFEIHPGGGPAVDPTPTVAAYCPQ